MIVEECNDERRRLEQSHARYRTEEDKEACVGSRMLESDTSDDNYEIYIICAQFLRKKDIIMLHRSPFLNILFYHLGHE